MMLTDQEKAKIRAEEIYRQEIFRELEPQKTTVGKVLAFFNTSLGYWLLTSLLVGLITYSFNFFQDRNREQHERQISIKRIDYEMQSRLYQYDVLVNTLMEMQSADSGQAHLYGSSRYMQQFSQTGPFDAWVNFRNGIPFQLFSVQYREFENRSMASLTTELIDLIDDANEKERLGILRLKIMSDRMFNEAALRDQKLSMKQLAVIQNYLKNELIMERWQMTAPGFTR